MKTNLILSAAFALALSPAFAAEQKAAPVDRAVFDKMLAETFAKDSPEWQAKMKLDETQRVCTETRNQPNNAQAGEMLEREAKTIKFPADGKLLGDVKAGHKVANTGTGNQFTDKEGTYVGGNCYACHQMDPKEVSYGTLGPSLMGYGKVHKDEAAHKEVWKKIYNSMAVVPCSNMPPFGHKGILTEQQMKDVMAYLLSPESPVNK